MAQTGDLLVLLEARIAADAVGAYETGPTSIAARIKGRFTPVGVLLDQLVLAFRLDDIDVVEVEDMPRALPSGPTDLVDVGTPTGDDDTAVSGPGRHTTDPAPPAPSAPVHVETTNGWAPSQRTRVLDLLEALVRQPGQVHSLIAGLKRRLRVQHLHELDPAGLDLVLRDVELLLHQRGGNP